MDLYLHGNCLRLEAIKEKLSDALKNGLHFIKFKIKNSNKVKRTNDFYKIQNKVSTFLDQKENKFLF